MARIRLRLVLLITLMAVFAASAGAADLGISPPDVTLKLNRGQAYQGELYIFGSSQETVNISAYLMDWSLTTSGEYQFLPLGTLARSAAPWVTYSPRSFSIPPKRGQKVLYTIKVPPEAAGSYWGVLMFNTNPTPLDTKGKVRVAMAARIAFIIRIDIAGSTPSNGSIERYRLSWDEAKQKVAASLRVKNSGSSFIRFKGRLELKDSQGKKVGQIQFKPGLVLPDSSREFSLADTELKLAPGYYVALLVADFGERRLKAVQTSLEIKK